MRSLETERAALAAAGRELAAAGLVAGGAGNLSLRVDAGLLVTAAGAHLGGATPEDVVLVGLDGELSEAAGGREPTSELDLHLALPGRAVIHSHPLAATALSAVLDAVPPVHYEMARLGGSIPVAPYARFGTPELARAVAETIGERPAALMANHGAIVQASDLGEALALTRLLEWCCEVCRRALAAGSPRALSDGEVEEAAAAFAHRRARGI